MPFTDSRRTARRRRGVGVGMGRPSTEFYDDCKIMCLARQWALSAWVPKERTGLEIIESSSAYRGYLKLWETAHKQKLSRA